MNISPLPTPGRNKAPNLPVLSGWVHLYNNTWEGVTSQDAYAVTTSDYAKNVRHSLVGTWINDQATMCAFNLPVGTVMTLMEHPEHGAAGGPVYDLKGCGRCIDLVGTGETVWFDLGDVGMNDCVSMFFWREVKLDAGAIELYEHNDFKGNRTVIFLGEWPSKTFNPITGWWMEDKVSSLRWQGLADTQQVTIAEHFDGGGRRYGNMLAWGSVKERASLPDMNDCMSSFRWDAIAPVKEVIEPITIHVDPTGPSAVTLTATDAGKNTSSEVQSVVVKLSDETAQTITATVVDTVLVSAGLEVYTEVSGEYSGVKIMVGLKMNVRTDYSHSVGRTNTVSKTTGVSVSRTANVPPNSRYKCTLYVKIGQIPRQIYQTKATRWYANPVRGATQDGIGWRRVEDMSVEIGGGLGSYSDMVMEATPL